MTSSTAKRGTGKSAKKTSTEKRTGIVTGKRTGIETVVAEKTDTGISMICMITMTGWTGRGNGIADRCGIMPLDSPDRLTLQVCDSAKLTEL